MGKKIEGFDGGVSVSAWWLVSATVDFRWGADRLLVHVREALGRDPLDGSAYVFCNRRTSRLKVLVVDGQGVWLWLRRLHQGRFVWPSANETLWSRAASLRGYARAWIGGVCHVTHVYWENSFRRLT